MTPRKLGDTANAPVFTCKAGGLPAVLAGAESVQLVMTHPKGATKEPVTTVLETGSTNVGKVRPEFAPTDVDTVGNWAVKIVVTYAGGQVQTFPQKGTLYMPIEA